MDAANFKRASLALVMLSGLPLSAAHALAPATDQDAEQDRVVISDPIRGRRIVPMTRGMRKRIGFFTSPQASARPTRRRPAPTPQIVPRPPVGRRPIITPDPDPTVDGVPDDGGWTVFTPASDSRIIFVSDSEGSDATGVVYDMSTPQSRLLLGSDPAAPRGAIKPFRTVQAAAAQMRDGKPDWLLFKRGDEWENQSLGRWSKSGRDDSARMLLTTYGDAGLPRPRFLTGTSRGMRVIAGDSFHDVAIVGLHFEPHLRQPTDSPVGIDISSQDAENILLEDCFVTGYSTNIVVQSRGENMTEDVTVRRCVITNSWSTTGHSEGLFVRNVNRVTIEECVFDHNGWNESIAEAEPTKYNHNMYLSTNNIDVIVRDCLSTRAAATACQARTGGIVENNVFLESPLGLNFG